MVAASARYSASAEEQEIVVYFLDFKKTKQSQRKIQNPDANLRVSGHVAQSASENVVSLSVEEKG